VVLEIKDCLDSLAGEDLPENKDNLVIQGMMDRPVFQEEMVLLVRRASPVFQVLLVNPETRLQAKFGKASEV